MIDDRCWPVACLVGLFFLGAVAFQAWAARQDARGEQAHGFVAPDVDKSLVGVAAVHPLPDVTPRRLVWDSYHRAHIVEEVRRD